MDKQTAIGVIDKYKKQLEQVSDALWDHPELGYEEHFAKDLYCHLLRKEGFRVEDNLAGIPTAFSGTYGSGRPIIGVLAEYDALPNLSQKAGYIYQEPEQVGGNGHGCGHNLLGAGSLGAVLAIKEFIKQNSKGTVVFLGCPAEENGSGKSFMTRAGVFADLDIALTWHPGDAYSVNNGSTNANYKVIYKFEGKSAHAAISPELGRSALDAVELMNVGVQFLREHISTSCRIHYAITDAGGTAPNVVQSHSEVVYLMRAPRLELLNDLKSRVDDISMGAALMTGTTVSQVFVKACANIVVNAELSQLLQKNMEEIGSANYSSEDNELAAELKKTISNPDGYYVKLADKVCDNDKRKSLLEHANDPIHSEIFPLMKEEDSVVSSDVGDVSWVCPVGQVYTATMAAGTPIHSWQEVSVGKSRMAHKGMIQAAKILAGAAIDVILNPDIAKRAQEELSIRTKGTPFVSPIPDNIHPAIPTRKS